MKHLEFADAAGHGPLSLPRQYFEDRQKNGYATDTLKLYRNHQEDFLNYLSVDEGIADPSGVDEKVMSRYQNRLERESGSMSSASRRVRLLAVKDLLMWLARRGLLSSDPAFSIKFPKRDDPSVKEFLRIEDLRKILAAVETETDRPRRLRDKAILELFCGHLIRRCEICALKVEDICPEREAFLIASGKNRSRRSLALSRKAMTAVEEYLAEGRHEFPNANHEPWLFLSLGGFQLNPWDITMLVKRYSRKAGFDPSVSSHGIRAALVNHQLQSKGENA